jgi:hypothetical protein
MIKELQRARAFLLQTMMTFLELIGDNNTSKVKAKVLRRVKT